MSKLSIYCYGSGAYTVGTPTTPATVLPAVFTYCKEIGLECHVIIISKNAASPQLRKTIETLYLTICGSSSSISYRLEQSADINTITIPKGAIAIVATPDQTHYSIIKALLTSRIPCLCVKPLVENIEQYSSLLDLSKAYQVPLICEFHKRYDPSLNYLYTALRTTDSISNIKSIDIYYKQRTGDSICQLSSNPNSNVFQYLGVHFIDVVSWLTDLHLQDISFTSPPSMSSSRIDTRSSWSSAATNTVIPMLMTNAWDASTASPLRSEQNIRIVTKLAEYKIDLGDRGFYFVDSRRYSVINPLYSSLFLDLNNLLSHRGYSYDCIKAALDVMRLSASDNTHPAVQASHRIAYISQIYDSIYTVQECNHWLADSKL
jgi:predicted dehydrogenase